jgi:glucan phosphoethanolaminetransferase (alkaline phosphatase superfamily)
MGAWRDHIVTWWDVLVHPEYAGRLVLDRDKHPGFNRFLTIGIALLYLVYGLSMGLFRGYGPAIVSGLKLPFLYLLTLAVCFPAFYALNCLSGPRLRVHQCIRLLLIATSANAAALSSYAPFSFFFTVTTSRAGYGFLVLMHVVVFGASAIASVAVIVLIFRTTAAELKHRLRPLVVLTWVILYALVGTQMSWVLRPWIGSYSGPYTPLRPIGGSFIEAVWNLVMRMIH